MAVKRAQRHQRELEVVLTFIERAIIQREGEIYHHGTFFSVRAEEEARNVSANTLPISLNVMRNVQT